MTKRKLLNQRRAVALTRVSTDEKRQELGVEAQRQAIAAWADANGVQIVGWHSDEASGTDDLANRPGLAAALGTMPGLDAGTLLVAKRDRLARDPLIAALTARDVERLGGRIVSADGVGNGTGPADEFMRTVVDAAHKYEVLMIRARIKAALAVKRARGERGGGAPYGYRAVGEKGARRLVEHAEEQAVLAAVRELRGNGLTVRAIASELKARGHLGRVWKGQRRPLSVMAVHGLLKTAGVAAK